MARRTPRVAPPVSGQIEPMIRSQARDQMAREFHRRRTIPLWTIALFTVAFTAPPLATLFVMTVLAIAVIALTTSGVPWLRKLRAAVHVFSV